MFAIDKRMAGLDSGDAAPLVSTFQMELAPWPVATSLNRSENNNYNTAILRNGDIVYSVAAR